MTQTGQTNIQYSISYEYLQPTDEIDWSITEEVANIGQDMLERVFQNLREALGQLVMVNTWSLEDVDFKSYDGKVKY